MPPNFPSSDCVAGPYTNSAGTSYLHVTSLSTSQWMFRECAITRRTSLHRHFDLCRAKNNYVSVKRHTLCPFPGNSRSQEIPPQYTSHVTRGIPSTGHVACRTHLDNGYMRSVKGNALLRGPANPRGYASSSRNLGAKSGLLPSSVDSHQLVRHSATSVRCEDSASPPNQSQYTGGNDVESISRNPPTAQSKQQDDIRNSVTLHGESRPEFVNPFFPSTQAQPNIESLSQSQEELVPQSSDGAGRRKNTHALVADDGDLPLDMAHPYITLDGEFCVPRNVHTIGKVRRKVDLSHVNLHKREASPMAFEKIESKRAVSFRANGGLRRVLFAFMTQFPRGRLEELSDLNIEELLNKIYTAAAIRTLQWSGYLPEDLLSWTWIFAASSSSQQIQRYIALSRDCRLRNITQPPTFIPLQLLRSERMEGDALRLLWSELVNDATHRHPSSVWDENSAPILLIRVIRHARRVDVNLCGEVVSFISKLLPQTQNELQSEQAIVHMRRLTHFYNRFLTLLALPSPRQPFRSVRIQQQAQLDLARYMYACEPPIIVNREGYRAFVQLQLRHPKTLEEQEWARVKSPTWPPWRRDQLGIHESLDYPGRHSRVMKVLQRMRESGYGPGDFEDAAQILAGWDTDQSPTIQVRRLMNARPMVWLRNLVSKDGTSGLVVEHNTWAARVEATRTIREAWLCFHSYMEATRTIKRERVVYNAMFQKLLAQTVSNDSLQSFSPGDGREVFADPISTRDLVYVPSDPPSVEELYSQMLGDGIKPAGRLLASLLRSVESSNTIFQYINDSTLSEIKRDVLLHAEKYPYAVIRSTLQQLPDYLLASFLEALVRARRSKSSQTFQKIASLSASSAPSRRSSISAFMYARQLLEAANTDYLPAHHAVLGGLEYRSKLLQERDFDNDQDSGRTATRIWDLTKQNIELLIRDQIVPDHRVVRSVSMIIQFLNAPTTKNLSDQLIRPELMSEVLKCLFWFTLVGRPISEHDWKHVKQFASLRTIPAKSVVTGSIPTYHDLDSMLQAFAALQEPDAVLALVTWLCDCDREGLLSRTRSSARRLLAASIRVAVEVSAGRDEVLGANDHVSRAISLVNDLGWATDDEVEEFVKRRNIHWYR